MINLNRDFHYILPIGQICILKSFAVIEVSPHLNFLIHTITSKIINKAATTTATTTATIDVVLLFGF